ncbi:MAG: hypothetical protein JRI23_12230 [Deltaproteobacteria bacterium]|jgi:hypothetical protein|nr:hypothetical protein [Deltaproteobacteria bacterium]MBW2532479.1 hypothetical protein [Deltaproteobacteria bacterium]
MKLSSSIPISRASFFYAYVDQTIDACEALLVDLFDRGVLRHFGCAAVVAHEDNLPHVSVPERSPANFGRLIVSFELPDGRGGCFEVGGDASLGGIGPGRLHRQLEAHMASAGPFESTHVDERENLPLPADDPEARLQDLVSEGVANLRLVGPARAFHERCARFEHPRLTGRQSFFWWLTDYRRLLTSYPEVTRARKVRARIKPESRLEYEVDIAPIRRTYPEIYRQDDLCRTETVQAQARFAAIPTDADLESIAALAEARFVNGVTWKGRPQARGDGTQE